ncbi:MAG: 2-hydroxyglutaryl-CoA dehydratase [Dethiobacter sp.]|jgi:predicted CoA-substrate-specific enzyme activase|nr:2-hydroxyglutaryl-CoA dehydratase [Dethiobacter sp.]
MGYVAGLDSGSTSTKLVVMQDEKIDRYYVVPTGGNSLRSAQKVLELWFEEADKTEHDLQCLVATGYGRENIKLAIKTVSEISCHAKGVHWLFPDCRVIIDIGGQDFKVIKLDKEGRVLNFAMNDKCAAGTGRYLELMANIFQMDLDAFGLAAFSAGGSVEITSVCTVFAESEVINHVSRGTAENEIVAGIFNAVARRVYSLAKQHIADAKEIVFTGGVAKNQGMIEALARITGCEVKVGFNPQITGALGAAIFSHHINGGQ